MAQDIGASLEYINRVCNDYLTYSGHEPGFLSGKRILEVGPGDNLGVALSLIAHGAESVVCVDAFRPAHDQQYNAQVYRALLERLTEEQRARLQNVVSFDGDDDVTFASPQITVHYEVDIARAYQTLGLEQFDIIISRAVLEHVADVEASWASMTKMLSASGEMWHKVDFRNHGLFAEFHPLFFLTVNDHIWNLISAPDPTLNRERSPTFERLARETFHDVDSLVTHIVDREELDPHPAELVRGTHYDESTVSMIESIRPQLLPRFREQSVEELMVDGVFLVCRNKKH